MARRIDLTTRRRASEVSVTHPLHGIATIQDNGPLSETALDRCLDDGLRAPDWLVLLNQRVFFWANRAGVDGLLAARVNRHRSRAILVFDTLRLVRKHVLQVEISPINSGSTIRNPARRGLMTFSPLASMNYPEWRRRRGQLDHIREIVVVGEVRDIADYLVDHWVTGSSLGVVCDRDDPTGSRR